MTTFTTSFIYNKYAKSKSIFEAKDDSTPVDQLEKDLNDALKLAEDKIDDSNEDAKEMSFNSIRGILDRLPSDLIKEDPLNPIIDQIFTNLVIPKKAQVVNEFVDNEEATLADIIKRNKSKEGVDLIHKRDDSYSADFNNSAYIIMRLEKLYTIYSKSSRKSKIDPEEAKKLSEISIKCATSIKNWYDWASDTFVNLVDDIKKGSTGEIESKLDSADEFSSNTGGSVFNMVFNYGSKETTVSNELEEISANIDKEDSTGKRGNIRRKKSIFRKIKESIAMAALPIIQNSEIKRPGDYYRLFITLNAEKSDWMKTILLNDVFNGQTSEFNDFISTISNEDPREEIQLVYLNACVEWTYKFIDSDYISIFTPKEIDDYRKAIQMIVLEKKSEIKNYYLSKNFNLGDFNSVHIKPEIAIPLYKTVNLMVSEEDRKKESSLRAILTGLGTAMLGMFSGIEVDTAALAKGNRFAAGDKKFMVGLNKMVKGMVGAVGGKDAARKYGEALPDKWKADEDKKKGAVKEDMLSPMDSPGSALVPMEGPGASHQTPGMMPGNNMDIMSLAGPLGGNLGQSKTNSKKSGKKLKKKKESFNSFGTTKVLNFEEFMKQGSIKS